MSIGFYSEKGSSIHGSYIYNRPDGTEVEVTSVFKTEDHGKVGCGWDDKVCVGPVTDFVRRGKPSAREALVKGME